MGGTRYAFRAVATDLVGHAEPDAGGEEAWTQVLGSRWQNTRHPCDVDNNSNIDARDVLLTINEINARGNHALLGSLAPPFLDPSGDGWIMPIDPLVVINYINKYGTGPVPTVAEGEGQNSTETAGDGSWPGVSDFRTQSSPGHQLSIRSARDTSGMPSSRRQEHPQCAHTAVAAVAPRFRLRPPPRRWEAAERALLEIEDILAELTVMGR